MKSPIAYGIGCALLLALGSAHAATATSVVQPPVSFQSIHAQIAACYKQPVSYRGICKAQVNRRVDEAYLSLPAGSVAIAPAFVEPVPAAAHAESLRYRSLSAECKRVPISERNSCVDEASLGYARPEPIGTTSLG